jgi:predicted GIY-YIG superfamily endonuclease
MAAVTNNWAVYIVRCADNSLYTGVSNAVEQRVKTHNAGQGARYTRSRLPVTLVHEEPAADRGAALRREFAIKSLSRESKQKLISGCLDEDVQAAASAVTGS